MPKPPAPSTRSMRKSPTSSVPSGRASRLPLDAGLGCIAFAITASPRPMDTRTREHHPRKTLVASFAPTNAPTAPNAATNGTLAECGQYCGGTMGAAIERSRATFSLGAARRPCSCPHAPARICSKSWKCSQQIFRPCCIAIALAGSLRRRLVASSPRRSRRGRQRISAAASPSKDDSSAAAHLARRLRRRGRAHARARRRGGTESAAADRRSFGRVAAADGRARLLPRAIASAPQGAERGDLARGGRAGIAEPARAIG